MAAASIDTHPFHGLASSLPVTVADCAALQGLSDNDVRAWSTAKADEYRRFALTLLSIYNAVAPIHRLPIEILSNIFEGCWTDRKSLRVGHADAVKGKKFSPNDYSTGHLAALLERSVPRMVVPTFYGFPAHLSPCLAPHADRFPSLVVVLRDHSEFFALWTCLNSGMHSLETLTIALIDDDSWIRAPQTPDRNPTLSPAAVPRLTQVTTPGRLIYRLSVPSLQHITLRTSEGQYFFYDRPESYETLQRTLEICAASLETLVLLDVAPSSTYDGVPLSLPALRCLRIRDSADRCARTLSLLVLPDTTRINCTNTDNARLHDAVPLDAPMIQLRLHATDYVAVVISAEETGVRCFAKHKELLSVRLAGAWRPDLRADDFVQLLRHTVRATRLGIGCLDARDSQGVDFRAFAQVSCIYIIGREAEEILRNLARGDGDDSDDGPAGPGRAVCPELKELAVYFGFEFRKEEGEVDSPAMGEEPRSGIEAKGRSLAARGDGDQADGFTVGMDFGKQVVSKTRLGCSAHVDLAIKNLGRVGAWGAILEPLEKLVDGPVVVDGYRVFSGDDR